ncbi:hypothetical protein [Sphingopyxis fribergensis]
MMMPKGAIGKMGAQRETLGVCLAQNGCGKRGAIRLSDDSFQNFGRDMFQPDIEIEHHERLLRVRQLRESGLIYREIAEALGISPARLSQLRPQVDRLPHTDPLLAMDDVTLRSELAYLPLSRRARAILAATAYRTVGDLVEAAGRSLRADRLPGCDPRSLREIQAFLRALEARSDRKWTDCINKPRGLVAHLDI